MRREKYKDSKGSKKHCWSSDSRATTDTIDPNNPRFPPMVYSTELKVFISSSPHTAKSFNTVRDMAGLEVSSRTGEIYCANVYSTVKNDRTIGGMRRLRDDESPSSNLSRLSPPGPQALKRRRVAQALRTILVTN
ncbi:unnamed protein product [Calypogeia fissa]